MVNQAKLLEELEDEKAASEKLGLWLSAKCRECQVLKTELASCREALAKVREAVKVLEGGESVGGL